MSKNILWLIGLLFAVSFTLGACEETDGAVDPYKDWQVRNERFIDSIASVARNNQGEGVGQWKIIHSYKFPQQGITMGDVDEYVYCKVLEVGDGETPLFTDTVSVNYRGWLIPLYNGQVVTFDQSYQGELNRDEAIPVDMVLYGITSTGGVTTLVAGWQTALQEMKVGDRWELYVPYDMGYGVNGDISIPGYSTLIFDLDLVGIKKLKGTPQE